MLPKIDVEGRIVHVLIKDKRNFKTLQNFVASETA
jgi:hypothetical protein